MLIPKGTCVVYCSCDAWKNKFSERIQGVFTSKRALLQTLKKEIAEKAIDCNIDFDQLRTLPTIEEMNKQLSFGCLKEITLNELK